MWFPALQAARGCEVLPARGLIYIVLLKLWGKVLSRWQGFIRSICARVSEEE